MKNRILVSVMISTLLVFLNVASLMASASVNSTNIFADGFTQNELIAVTAAKNIAILAVPEIKELLSDPSIEIHITHSPDLQSVLDEHVRNSGDVKQGQWGKAYQIVGAQMMAITFGYVDKSGKTIFMIYLNDVTLTAEYQMFPWVIMTHEFIHLAYRYEKMKQFDAGKKIFYDPIEDEINAYTKTPQLMREFLSKCGTAIQNAIGKEKYKVLENRIEIYLQGQDELAIKWRSLGHEG